MDIRKEDVLELLKSIKLDKSPGPDCMYPRLLWEAREETVGGEGRDCGAFGDDLSIVDGDGRGTGGLEDCGCGSYFQ